MKRLMILSDLKRVSIFGRIMMSLAILCILSGCGKSQFKISFQFPQEYQGNYLLTYYAWDSKKGFWVETTVAVQEGKAETEAFTSRPTLIYVTDASSSSNSIAIYAEKGDEIVISGDNPDMLTWSVKGNRLSERWSSWRNANAGALREGRLGGDSSEGKKEKAIATYVKDNPADKLSMFMLLTDYDRHADPEGFLRLWNSLDDDLKTPKATEVAGCPDLLGVAFQVDPKGNLAMAREKKLPQIVLRSKGNGVDTLRFTKSKASLMYFYTNTVASRRAAADSVKALAKEYPDSATRIIADISLESDSIAWTGNIRGDSITKVIRGWMPKGVADRDMIRMGVARAPWLIVADKKGTPVYSGDDIAEALKAFRKTIDKK